MIKLSSLVEKASIIAAGLTLFAAIGSAVIDSNLPKKKADAAPEFPYVLAVSLCTLGIGIGACGIKLGDYIKQEEDLNESYKNGTIIRPENTNETIKENLIGLPSLYTRPINDDFGMGIKYLKKSE